MQKSDIIAKLMKLTNEQSRLITDAIDDIKIDEEPKYKIIKRLGDKLEKTGIPKSSITKTIKAVLTVPMPDDEKSWPKGYAGKDYISRCFDSSYKDYSMWHLSGDGGEEKLSEIKEKMSKKQQANAAKLHKKPIAKGDIVLTGIKKEKPKPKKEKIKIKKQQQKPKIDATTATIAGLDVARKREKQQKGELIKKAIEDEEKQFKELKPIKASAGTGKETIFYEGAKFETIGEAEAVIDISVPISTIDSELTKKIMEMKKGLAEHAEANNQLLQTIDRLSTENMGLRKEVSAALREKEQLARQDTEIGSKAADNLIADLETKLKEVSKPFKSRQWLTVKLGGKDGGEPVFTIIQYDVIAVPETRQINVPANPNFMKRVSPDEKEKNKTDWEKETKGRKTKDIDIKAESAA